MAQIKVIHDSVGETLTVYWDDPEREEVCEEVGHGFILKRYAGRGYWLRAVVLQAENSLSGTGGGAPDGKSLMLKGHCLSISPTSHCLRAAKPAILSAWLFNFCLLCLRG